MYKKHVQIQFHVLARALDSAHVVLTCIVKEFLDSKNVVYTAIMPNLYNNFNPSF